MEEALPPSREEGTLEKEWIGRSTPEQATSMTGDSGNAGDRW